MDATRSTRKAAPHVARRTRIGRIAGVATATNARAARHDDQGEYFQADPLGRHPAVEARVLDLVRRCERYALATWGHAFDVYVRLDDREARQRSRGGLYHSRWKTERVDHRAGHDRRGGISIAVARRVPLAAVDPFRPGEFHEYAHLSPWGDVGTTAAFPPLDVCVAHEVAHAFTCEAWEMLCERLALHPAASIKPHGRLFAEVYARLRRHLGLCDPTRPEWLALAPEARARALKHTRKPLPPELAVLAATDPAAYSRHVRAARQRERRRARRIEAGAVA
jgi:hypothetical protein